MVMKGDEQEGKKYLNVTCYAMVRICSGWTIKYLGA